MNIHIMHTGGTIGSAYTEDARRIAVAPGGPRGAAFLTVPADVRVSESSPFRILSENMTTARWREMILHLRTLALRGKDGLLVTHGTDTLAYTACLLTLLFSKPEFPVILVSADKPPEDPASNGPENFAAAITAVREKIPPGVYAVYRNGDGRTYLHAGAELLQCPCGGADFFSVHYGGAAGDPLAEIRAGRIHCRKAPSPVIPSAPDFPEGFDGRFARVLSIRPYVGLRYDHYLLDEADAVLHGLYHSSAAAALTEEEDAGASVLHFAKRCADAGVPLYAAPFPEDPARGGKSLYETTARMLRAGVIPLTGVTFEMALVMLTLGLAPPDPPCRNEIVPTNAGQSGESNSPLRLRKDRL
jgi:L-asparaginase